MVTYGLALFSLSLGAVRPRALLMDTLSACSFSEYDSPNCISPVTSLSVYIADPLYTLCMSDMSDCTVSGYSNDNSNHGNINNHSDTSNYGNIMAVAMVMTTILTILSEGALIRINTHSSKAATGSKMMPFTRCCILHLLC